MTRYDLPPDFTKKTDKRRVGFGEKPGDFAVELDSLPPDVSTERLTQEVGDGMDLKTLAKVRILEETEKKRILIGVVSS